MSKGDEQFVNIEALRWALRVEKKYFDPDTGEEQGLTASEHSVLTVLAIHFNKDEHRAWPTIKTICDCTSLSRATVYRAINKLRAKRLIQREPWISLDRLREGQPANLSDRFYLPAYDPASFSTEETVFVLSTSQDGHGVETLDDARTRAEAQAAAVKRAAARPKYLKS
jgi:hypothetical protein